MAEFSITEPIESERQLDFRVTQISNLGLDEIAELLDSLGDQRFMARSRGFSLELAAGENTDQILYIALMEALGYKSNQKPFRLLANLVPYRTLRRYRDDPYETRVAAIEASLISASGFLSGLEGGPRKSQLARLARKARLSRKLRLEEWKLFRVRPNNHPAHRMSGFARILAKSTVAGLAIVFKTAMLQQDVSGVLDILDERPYIGADRAHEMVVNVVLPYLHCLSVLGDDRRLMAMCLDEYREMKPSPSYGSAMRFAESVEIPTDRKFIKTARRQQGLLHLQKHFANYADRFDVQQGAG